MWINIEYTSVSPLCWLRRAFGEPVELDVCDGSSGPEPCQPAERCPRFTASEIHFFFFSFIDSTRSYVDVSRMDAHAGQQMSARLEPDDSIYWHEGSKPGTIV